MIPFYVCHTDTKEVYIVLNITNTEESDFYLLVDRITKKFNVIDGKEFKLFYEFLGFDYTNPLIKKDI